MKKLLTTIEKLMNAVTFAEAGEWETARQMMPKPLGARISRLEKMFMAAAFAEEGLQSEALHLLGASGQSRFDISGFFSSVGLEGARVKIGVLVADASA